MKTFTSQKEKKNYEKSNTKTCISIYNQSNQKVKTHPLHSRQGICNNIVFALNVVNNNVILLQQQTPPSESLILV